MTFVMARDNKTAFVQDLELICLWFERYREGLLTANDFKTLVAGRITVMYMRARANYKRYTANSTSGPGKASHSAGRSLVRFSCVYTMYI
jgi:hypothetical protein